MIVQIAIPIYRTLTVEQAINQKTQTNRLGFLVYCLNLINALK